MTIERKATLTEEQLEFIRENFSGASDADRIRAMIAVVKYIFDQQADRTREEVRNLLTDEAVEPVDFQDAAAEGVKRALLESEDIELTDLLEVHDRHDT